MNDDHVSGNSRTPVVSIVMPVYNAEPYLAEAINSILAQTWKDFELIVVDDGSTDRSMEIIRTFDDKRIRYVRNERNHGVAASRNRGVHLSRGEFVAQMDQDDIARPCRIAKQVSYLRKHPDIGMCGGNIIKFFATSRILIRFLRNHEEIRVTHLFHAGFAHPTVMSRRALLVENELFYDESCRNLEDYELWCKLVEKTKVANLDRVLLEYRSHSNQLSRENSEYFTKLLQKLHRRVLERILPDLSEEELRLHFQISMFGDTNDIPSLLRVSTWMNKLITANLQHHVYSTPAMGRVFGRKWAWMCGQAAGLGFPVFRIYWNDPLSVPVRYSVDTLKLLVKCALRRQG